MSNRDTTLVLADLIAKKMEKESKKRKSTEYFAESLGGKILIEVPEEQILLKAMDKLKEATVSSVMDLYIYLIYHSVALFRSPDLHKEYDVVDPLDIVFKLLELDERFEVGEEIMKLSGLDRMEDNVKN